MLYCIILYWEMLDFYVTKIYNKNTPGCSLDLNPHTTAMAHESISVCVAAAKNYRSNA